MPVLILKDAPCILKTKKGAFELKGYYALNTISDNLLKELRELNPELDVWLDKGVAVVNKNAANVKADGLMEAEKAAAERLILAEAEAERIVAEAKAGSTTGAQNIPRSSRHCRAAKPGASI